MPRYFSNYCGDVVVSCHRAAPIRKARLHYTAIYRLKNLFNAPQTKPCLDVNRAGSTDISGHVILQCACYLY